MNCWTVPLRLSLTCWLSFAVGLVNKLMHTAIEPQYHVLYEGESLLGWTFGVWAIWCWGRK